jgi:hypothetical protein
MESKKQGTPISTIEIDDRYIIAIYQGSYGENPKLDFRIAYREWVDNQWTRIRQPKHIHWAVDLLVEKLNNKKLTTAFIQHMLNLYDEISPLKTKKDQTSLLDNVCFEKIDKFKNISNGFYTIKFIYCIMYLLIVEEKTSSATAHMFKELLEKLKTKDDFYGIVNTATHNGKK